MEKVIKAQLNEDLFIEDETDIFIFLFIEKTWIIHILLHLERRRYIPRLGGFSEKIVPQFDSKQFLRHFRVSPEIFDLIMNSIVHSLTDDNAWPGAEPILPEKKLLVFLWYMANQETLREVSNIFAIGTTTVHEIVMTVSETVNENLVSVTNWPDANTQQALSRQFQLQSGLPVIIGSSDGTHIRLSSAPGGDKDYFNRKNFPSIQLQFVADCDMLIRDAYTGWPWCTHDAQQRRFNQMLLFLILINC